MAATSSPATDHPANLPRPLTAIIGREREAAKATELLRDRDVRLLTLTGPGGVGKTRLGLEVAAALGADFAGDVYFADLAPLVDPESVPYEVARALGVREVDDRPLRELREVRPPIGFATPGDAQRDTAGRRLRREQMTEVLTVVLHGREFLLLLDNFEHVLPATGLVAQLLADCPQLKVLATSRARLRVPGERVLAVGPLATPDPERLPPLAQLASTAATRLFVERARALAPDFALTAGNASAVAAICHRLDGLPLAIELAAGWVNERSPRELLAQLEAHRLELLVDGGYARPARHRTLRNTLAWSYELLLPAEQALFRRLAVFVGSCTPQAAAVVGGAVGAPEIDALRGIPTLVDRSLLRREGEPDGESRYAMPETVREYGREQLAASGETEVTKRAHAAYYLALAERAEEELTGPSQVEWLARLEAEYANLEAVLDWALGQGEDETALRLGAAIWRFWQTRGYHGEGRAWLERVTAETGRLSLAARAKALIGLGSLAVYFGDYPQARARYEESYALRQSLGDQLGVAEALTGLGMVAADLQEHDRARELHEAALAIHRELGDRRGVAGSQYTLGFLARDVGDYAAARSLFEHALAVWSELGNLSVASYLRFNLGVLARLEGDASTASRLFEQGLAGFRQVGDKLGRGIVLIELGRAARAQGDDRRAAELYAEALTLLRETRSVLEMVQCLEGLATVASAQGQSARAARLFGAAAAQRETLGLQFSPPSDHETHKQLVKGLGERPGAAWALKWEVGQALTLDEVIGHGWADPGDPEWEAGRALTLDEAVAEALAAAASLGIAAPREPANEGGTDRPAGGSPAVLGPP